MHRFLPSLRRVAHLFSVVAASLLACGVCRASEAPAEPPVIRGFMTARVGFPGVDFSPTYFAEVKSWGANAVRLQVSPDRYAEMRKAADIWEYWPDLLDQVEASVKNARDAGVMVVVDLHNPPLLGVDRRFFEAWNHPDFEKNFLRVWTDLATRLLPYRDAIWGYDILNEPINKDEKDGMFPPTQWPPVARHIIETIRAIDPDVWIVYEHGPWGHPSGFESLEPLPYPKIIYSVHVYRPDSFTHQGLRNVANTHISEAMEKVGVAYPGVADGVLWNRARMEEELAPVVDFQRKHRVPIFVGEFSVVRWAPEDSAVRWLTDVLDIFETHGWSWTYHAFREAQVWSLEHDGEFWMRGMPAPKRATEETARARVVKAALGKNTEQPAPKAKTP